MTEKIQNFMLMIASIIIGIPLGIVVGLICWFKFPFQIYWQARANLDLQRVERAKEQIKHYEEEDIWERHQQRMEEKNNNYDN
tara:strand:+ start:69 stop:317 length:249 start_codon:yes stop_codon:yes gene_type:complete